jgi:hypothetical protein
VGIGVGLVALVASVLFAGAGPAAASTGYIDVAFSEAGALVVAVQQDGTTPWTIEEVASASNSTSWGSPSLYRQTTGGLVLAVVRSDGSLWFFWQGPGATNWNPEEVAGPGTDDGYNQPAIASQSPLEPGDQTETMIVVQTASPTGGANYYTQVNGTPEWTSGKLPTATGIADQPDVTVAPDDTFLVSFSATAQTNDNETYFQVDRLPYNSSTWSDVVISTNTGQLQNTSIIEQPAGGVIVAASDFSGNTYFFWSPSGQPTVWYQESVKTGLDLTSVASYIQPMALTGDDTGVAVAAPNSTGECDLALEQADGATGWNSQTVACSSGPATEALGLQPNSHNEVAATVDALGHAYFYWQQDGTDTWHTEEIPGSGSATPYTSASIAVT